MAPESNQQSSTAPVRVMVPSHSWHGKRTRSIDGLCRSKPSGSSPARSRISAALPSASSRPQASQTQNGRGVPQYLSRDTFQSTLFSSHSPKRPAPTSGGIQRTSRCLASMRSFRAVVRMYQAGAGK